MLELLAERTLAESQLRKQLDADSGYASRLFDFLDPILDICVEANIPIITNGGAANPQAAAVNLRAKLNGHHPQLKIACVLGDDLLEQPFQQWLPTSELPGELVSVNVYTGADGIVQALAEGANIVLCGRVADPSLAVGPIRHALGWAFDDWQKMAIATTAGHLLECCTQVTGGYFAHPGIKDVPNPANLDCPIIEISATGDLIVTKVEGASGYVNERTVKEQLLYEIHDPRRYLTPDVILDLGQVRVEQIGENRVRVSGIQGHPQPETLKGLAGVRGLWFGEASISYAGPGAVERANLAREILHQRFAQRCPQLKPWIDLVGVASLFNDQQGHYLNKRLGQSPTVEDVQVRVGIVDENRQLIEQLQAEVESLYTNGPAGGGGVRRHLSESLTTRDFLVPRSAVETRLEWY